MAGSLKDQLLKQGLVDKKKLKQAEHEARQSKSKKTSGKSAADTGAADAADQRARAEATLKARAAADRERAKALQAEREAAEKLLRIRQIVASHKQPKGGDVPHNFVHDTIVKKLWVKKAQHEAIARGQLRIVHVGGEDFELVPAEIAERLEGIDAGALVAPADTSRADRLAAEEAAYADHQIPDDLDW